MKKIRVLDLDWVAAFEYTAYVSYQLADVWIFAVWKENFLKEIKLQKLIKNKIYLSYPHYKKPSLGTQEGFYNFLVLSLMIIELIGACWIG